MTIIWVLVSILIAWVFGKWILLLLTSPLIILFSKRERRKAIELQMADHRIKEDRNTCLNQIDPQDIDQSGTKRALNIIYSLFSNFLRYEIIQVGTIPSHHIRNFIYKNIFLVRKNKRSIIHYGAEIRGAYNLIIEKGAVIGDKTVLDARRGFIKIGKNVQFGNSVSLWTGSHDLNDPFFRSRAGKRGPIIIEDYVWIGPDVTVLHSVTIGKGAVIAAGSIVTSDVPPFSVMAGIPAKKIGERNSNLRYDLSKYKPHIY